MKQIIETILPLTQPALQKMLDQMKHGELVTEKPDIEELNRQLAKRDWNPTDKFD